MLKDYTTIKCKNCSTKKFLHLYLALLNSQVVTNSTAEHSTANVLLHDMQGKNQGTLLKLGFWKHKSHFLSQ